MMFWIICNTRFFYNKKTCDSFTQAPNSWCEKLIMSICLFNLSKKMRLINDCDTLKLGLYTGKCKHVEKKFTRIPLKDMDGHYIFEKITNLVNLFYT